MAFRTTLIFDYPSIATLSGENAPAITRAAGWTESYCSSSARLPGDAKFDNLVQGRAAALSKGLAILGYRTADLDHNTGTAAGKLFVPGAWDGERDVANIVQHWTCQNGPNKLNLKLHGITDGFIRGGDIANTKAAKKVLGRFFAELPNWGQICRKLDNPSARIESIDAEGVCTLEAAIANLEQNDYVHVLRTKSTFKRTKNKYRVGIISNGGKTFPLIGWERGLSTGGRVREVGSVFVPYLDQFTFEWIETRKAGGPSYSQHGRR